MNDPSVKKKFDAMKYIPSNRSGIKVGLVEGNTGILLCHACFYLVFQEDKYLDTCQNILSSVLSCRVRNYSLGYGLTGLTWTMKQLEKLGLIDLSEYLAPSEHILKKKCEQMILSGNLDYFSGAAGILNYFSGVKEYDEEINHLFDLYIDKIKSASDFSVFKRENSNPHSSCINLGVPHGIMGAILLLLKLHRYRDVHQIRVSVICNLFEKLFESRNPEGSKAILPSYTGKTNTTLAWCYGDLPFLYGLIKARDEGIKDYSEEIEYMIERTCKRRDSMKDNLSLCHGNTIVAYLYFKIWKRNQDPRCYEQFQYWKNESHKIWNNWCKNSHAFFDNHSFINGYSGFLIAILTMEERLMTNEWDSCLML